LKATKLIKTLKITIKRVAKLTEGHKKRQTEYRTAQPFTLAFFRTWGIHRSWSYQLAVAKVSFLFSICNITALFLFEGSENVF
jgi:hypothetical protein